MRSVNWFAVTNSKYLMWLTGCLETFKTQKMLPKKPSSKPTARLTPLILDVHFSPGSGRSQLTFALTVSNNNTSRYPWMTVCKPQQITGPVLNPRRQTTNRARKSEPRSYRFRRIIARSSSLDTIKTSATQRSLKPSTGRSAVSKAICSGHVNCLQINW